MAFLKVGYVKDLEQEFLVLVPPEETGEEPRETEMEEKGEGREERKVEMYSGRKAWHVSGQ